MTEDIEAKKEKLLEMLKIFLEHHLEWDDEKSFPYMDEMEKLTLDPELSGYIFWPNHYGYDRDLTPEEIVDICFSYKPIIL